MTATFPIDPKTALYQTVHKFGAIKLAATIGMGHQVLVNKVNPHNTSNHANLDDLMTIIGATSDVSVLESIAHAFGYLLVKAPSGIEADGDLLGAAARAFGSSGRVADVLHDSLRDGKITRAEVAALGLAVFHAQQRQADLVETLRGMAEQ